IMMKAADEFKDKTTAPNQLWQTDFTYLNRLAHVRGAPYHPMTQGKIERWHQTLKNRILPENYFLPGDLEGQIDTTAAITRASIIYPRPTSTSDAARQSCCKEKGLNARPSLHAACSTNGKPRNIINKTSQSLP